MKDNRFDIVTKIVTALGALLAGIVIPYVINSNAEKNRQNQLYIQIMSEREKSDSALRAQMFNSLISSYFGPEINRDPQKQIMFLHLLTLNFQEFFDAKPLLEDLDKRVQGENKVRLQHIAMEIADRQINMLTKPENKPVELNLCVANTVDCPTANKFTLEGTDGSTASNWKEQARDYDFVIELLAVQPSEAEVRVSAAMNSPEEKFNFKPIQFAISYYDTPFMNNTRLWNGNRFALTLKNVNQETGQAVIRVITFPEQFMSLRDRPYFDEILTKLDVKNE